MEHFPKALAALRRLGDHLVEDQIYAFDGISEPRQARELCRRIGIPETDDEFITYPIRASFTPIPASHIRSLEVALGASFTMDYRLLLEKVGPFHLPGEPKITLFAPASICAFGAGVFNFEQNPPWHWPAVPIGNFGKNGDSIGFLRANESFASDVHILSHELPWRADSNGWHKVLCNSLSQLVLERAEQLAGR